MKSIRIRSGEIYTEVGTGGQDSYTLDGRSPFISQQLISKGGFLDVAFPDKQTMKGTFYDNSGSIKDEFTIKKSGTTPSNSPNFTSFSASIANASTANSTEWNLDALNPNGTSANLNRSVIASPLPIPSKDNQSSLQNITDDNLVGSNQSESNRIKDHVNRTTGDETSPSQDPPNTNASRAVLSDIINDTIRNKASKIAIELAQGALNEAEQALNKAKVSANRNMSQSTDVTKSSEQSVNHGGQIPSITIDRDNEHGMPIKYRLAQDAIIWRSLLCIYKIKFDIARFGVT